MTYGENSANIYFIFYLSIFHLRLMVPAVLRKECFFSKDQFISLHGNFFSLLLKIQLQIVGASTACLQNVVTCGIIVSLQMFHYQCTEDVT